MYHFLPSSAERRSVGDATIENLVTAASSPNLSVAFAKLDGTHARGRSRRSDRAYYVISGSAAFIVGEERFTASAGHAVLVPKGTEHGFKGVMEYVVVNSPAFDPSAEEPSG